MYIRMSWQIKKSNIGPLDRCDILWFAFYAIGSTQLWLGRPTDYDHVADGIQPSDIDDVLEGWDRYVNNEEVAPHFGFLLASDLLRVLGPAEISMYDPSDW